MHIKNVVLDLYYNKVKENPYTNFKIILHFYFPYIKAYLCLFVIFCDKDHQLSTLPCFYPTLFYLSNILLYNFSSFNSFLLELSKIFSNLGFLDAHGGYCTATIYIH
jgi:hypothetical protein